ncbi:Gfo/Idh/MocA family oxidoreductase [Paenibacillus sp. CC-CFT747]|nr:Gfo/Idh/MocA family oxidoreductase [Paenibacillus sp. CC-CFT747]
MVALMGTVSSVGMMAGNLAHTGEGFGDEDDVLLVSLSFAEGGFGTLQYGSGFQWGEHYIKINGSEGAIQIDFRNSVVEWRAGGVTQAVIGLHGDPDEDAERVRLYRMLDGGVIYGDPQKRPPAFLRTPMRREMQAFCGAIQGKPMEEDKKLLFDGTAALHSVAAASAALQARDRQQIVRLDSVLKDFP